MLWRHARTFLAFLCIFCTFSVHSRLSHLKRETSKIRENQNKRFMKQSTQTKFLVFKIMEEKKDDLENSDPNLKKRKAEGMIKKTNFKVCTCLNTLSCTEMDTDQNNDDEEELHCNICFEPWSNTGSHRIASLKCGQSSIPFNSLFSFLMS